MNSYWLLVRGCLKAVWCWFADCLWIFGGSLEDYVVDGRCCWVDLAVVSCLRVCSLVGVWGLFGSLLLVASWMLVVVCWLFVEALVVAWW